VPKGTVAFMQVKIEADLVIDSGSWWSGLWFRASSNEIARRETMSFQERLPFLRVPQIKFRMGTGVGAERFS
jgi:hypothetical protein